MFRLCEEERAELFMKATNIYNSKEKLFAADIYSHSQCMNKYLLQYKRDMQVETENPPQDYSENIKKSLIHLLKLYNYIKKVIQFHFVEMQ